MQIDSQEIIKTIGELRDEWKSESEISKVEKRLIATFCKVLVDRLQKISRLSKHKKSFYRIVKCFPSMPCLGTVLFPSLQEGDKYTDGDGFFVSEEDIVENFPEFFEKIIPGKNLEMTVSNEEKI